MAQERAVLNQLQAAGYEAYFVGGCVRDGLLGRPVHDWDITTSALPEQVMKVFPKCVPTGEKHGTVTVLMEGESFEVTTFRSDGVYLDSRHPERVTFVPNLREDLQRRDFTINAMAMDLAGNVIDPFGGRADLELRVIRCVGDPETRFREDALRMLRAIRFSAQLGFSIAPETLAAIKTSAANCRHLSAERVRDEMEKTLLSDRPDAVLQMADLRLLTAVGIERVKPCDLASLPKDRAARWAGFFRACPESNWQTLRLDKKTGATASRAAQIAFTCKTRLDWKKLISREGGDTACCAAALTGDTETVSEILSSGECLNLAQLAVSGKDFPELSGKAVGERLARLLDHVLEHPEDNKKEILLKQ